MKRDDLLDLLANSTVPVAVTISGTDLVKVVDHCLQRAIAIMEDKAKEPKFYSRRAAAEALGTTVQNIDRMARDGLLTRQYIGKKTVFAASEVNALRTIR